MTEPTIRPWSMAGPDTAPHMAAPEPSEPMWELPCGGFGLVYRAPGHARLERPVIFADGFNTGPSEPDEMWQHMDGGRGGYRLVTQLWNQGNDVILLGYGERSARIQHNAGDAIRCIERAIEGRPDLTLAVGGFSMGGLVTRYALAKMERDEIAHQTEVYFSYDSPHRGAWIPISLQALAHLLKAQVPDNPMAHVLSNYINSDAARQLVWRHIETYDGQPEEDPLREEFLRELADLGGWPRQPRKIGVANGSGRGAGQGIPAKAEMLKILFSFIQPFRATTLYAQEAGADQLVAELRWALNTSKLDVKTSGIPALDNAPGGKLETFGIVRDTLAALNLGAVESNHRWVDFVPSVSAVAIRDPDSPDLYADIGSLQSADSELDDFLCAPGNEEHSLVTRELGEWLLARLPK